MNRTRVEPAGREQHVGGALGEPGRAGRVPAARRRGSVSAAVALPAQLLSEAPGKGGGVTTPAR